jgi:hypothetical protein
MVTSGIDLTGPARSTPTGAGRFDLGRQIRRPAVLLAGVAVLLVAIQFTVKVWRGGVGWDEALYISQVSPRLPASFLDAPRARGITYLIAPAEWATGSLTLLRAYLAVLSGVAIVAAFWPWLALTSRRAVVPLAALLFGSLWITQYYGSEVIPNFWVAVAGVAMAGWFLRYGDAGGRTAFIGLVAGGAVAALMRPGDAFWIWLPLLVAALIVRRWRRPTVILALVAGPVLGTAQWIIEAFTRFGGPLERLRQSSDIQGGMGWDPRGILYELHALNGPLQCRPCGTGVEHPGLVLWWLVLPLLVMGGLLLTARDHRSTPAVVAAACGLSAAVPYLFLLGYSAPRFLLPAYALLALPVAECLAGVPSRFPRARVPLAALIAVAVVAQVGSQQLQLVTAARDNAVQRRMYSRGAAGLRRLGLHAPCMLSGPRAVPIAIYLGCGTGSTSGILTSMTEAQFLEVAHREPTGILTHGTRPPGYAASWIAHPLSGLGRRWVVYLPPWYTPPS